MPLTESEELELLELENANAIANGNGQSSEKSLAENVTSAVVNTPTRERPKSAAEAVTRFAKDTMETFSPPTSIEGVKRFLSPAPGQYGALRTGQDISTYGREDINKLAESFVQKPGIRDYPRLAATIGTGGAMMGDMLVMSPRDVAVGAGMGKIVKGLNAAEMGIRGAAKNTGKSLISTTLGPTKEAVSARFENPKGFKEANQREWIDVAQKATDAVKQASKTLEKKSTEAFKTLSQKSSLSDGGIEKSGLFDNLEGTIRNLEVSEGGAIGPAQEKAIAVLQKIKDRLVQVGEQPGKTVREVIEWDTSGLSPQKVTRQIVEMGDPRKTGISERSLKEIIQQLDKNINWDDPSAGPVNDALENLRVGYDGLLKNRNSTYEKAMRPVSAITRTIMESKKMLGLVDKPGEGIVPGSNTEAALKNLSGATRGNTRKMLGKLKSITGSDIPAESKLQSLADQFKGGKTQGSRRVNLGRAAGAAIGSIPGYLMGGFGGAAAGGVAGELTGGLIGAKIDVEGGKMAGTLIDRLASIQPMMQPLGRYGRSAMAQILEAAGRRSGQNRGRR